MGPLKDVKKVLERVSDACNVPYGTVKRINIQLKEEIVSNETEQTSEEHADVEEAEQPTQDGANVTSSKKRRILITTPRKKKPRTPRNRPVTEVDDFQKSAIRRHIMTFYERKEVPTLRRLQGSLQDAGLFNGCKSSLATVLKSLGFAYKKFNSRKVLMEKPAIALKRCQFLRKTRDIDLKNTVFLDETWLNENTCHEKGWTDGSVRGTLSAPLGKGRRLIVCHAGTQDGWIKAPPLVFQSCKTGDYHEEMDSKVFEHWFFNTLIPVLPPSSTIIMDNAPYHSRVENKAPTSSSTKAEMTNWLNDRGVCFPQDLKKPELYNVVKLHKPPHPTYVIDSKAAELGFKVIRLPPYHCQYNAIEMVWGYIKKYVKDRNQTFKLSDLKVLFSEAVSAVTPELWGKYVKHVKNLMEEDWRSEGLNDLSVREFVINLCPGDTDSESDSDSNAEDEDFGCAILE
ncbi:uncharacterized protein LOC128984711 [Macrosteles quadrilineatus]|uniref:uncharacterized protein LOC128984711 n=1 Tax=Macrosteles quadrilineatus TaxID=74068 RepID=UPI0023E34EA1|nr:uncharacterized protein LOC128984711 [Macrosteles quadrilineatus]